MKHKRVSNRRMKQILGEIIYDDSSGQSPSRDSDQTLVEKKHQSTSENPPNLNIDSENK
ncbi:hypothetical protein MD588_23055 [Photobacterium sp. SDRW27]|uniref:hypothetical protein n=1 Tax=Photobacterium obscurum TaxID=2829490 RepID=UPI002244BE78|nr:hypothetical protein [Photobacterium obscurum]MCW8331682.1 hypothetical protein [Photobacterium obscurum]